MYENKGGVTLLTFIKVEAQNFKSFKEMELDLNDRGVMLINGENKTNDSFTSNGSGKTTAIQAITYAIYDTTGEKLKADEVMNREERKNTFVKLYFEKDKVPYRIERYRKHKTHKNKVLFFENDREITSSTNAKTNDLIQDVIGITKETYFNSIMYGSSDAPIFSQATDKGKKEILENITNIEVYKKAQEVAKEKVKEQESLQDELDQEIENTRNKMENTLRSVQEAKDNYKHIHNQIQKAEKDLHTYEEQKKQENFDQQINELEEQLTNLNNVEQETFQPDTSKVEEAKDLVNQLTEKKNEFTYLIRQLDDKYMSAEQEQNALDTQDVCPTCGAPLDADHAKKRWQELEEDKQNFIQTRNEYQNVYSNQFEPVLKQAQDKVQNEETKIEQQRQEHQSKQMERNNQINTIQTKINTVQSNKNMLELSIQQAQEQLDSLQEIPEPDMKEDELNELEKSIDHYKEQQNQYYIARTKYGDAVKAFSNTGIRSVVLDLVTPTLNENANYYLNLLSDSYLKVRFTTQVENQDGSLRDKFDVEITHGDTETTYQTLSQGERTRVDVAISLALQDLVYSNSLLRANIALYDEVFDGLDEKGVSSVIDILKEKAKEVGTIFVITHSDTFKPLFENVLTVRKENGESKLMKES